MQNVVLEVACADGPDHTLIYGFTIKQTSWIVSGSICLGRQWMRSVQRSIGGCGGAAPAVAEQTDS